jgi:uncharacterized Zn finger protein
MPSVTDFTSHSQMRALADARGWTDGMALADANVVVFETVTPERVVATVNAADGPARVELTAGDRFGYTCSCTDVPEACRHIVATALALPRASQGSASAVS